MRPLLAGLMALLALTLPVPAAAHAPIPGIGMFFSGALHPLIAPALLLSLSAYGLLLGQACQGRLPRAGWPLGALLAAMVLGLALHRWAEGLDTDRLLLLCGAFAGVAVALAWRLPRSINLTLGFFIGLATGLASAPSGVQGRDWAVMLAGTLLASFGLPAWVAAMVTLAEHAWLKIAVRVLGSWLAAAAFLVLSLSFAPAARGPGAPASKPGAGVYSVEQRKLAAAFGLPEPL